MLAVNAFAVSKLAECNLLEGKGLVDNDYDKAYKYYKEGLENRSLLTNVSDINSYVIVEKKIHEALFELACLYIKQKEYQKGNEILVSLNGIHSQATEKHVESLYLEALGLIKTEPQKSISLLDSAVLKGNLLISSLEKNLYIPIEKKIIEAYITTTDKLISINFYELAISTISKLFDKHAEAVSKYISYKIFEAKVKLTSDINNATKLLEDALESKSLATAISNVTSIEKEIEEVYNTYILVSKAFMDKGQLKDALLVLKKIESLHKSAMPMTVECHYL